MARTDYGAILSTVIKDTSDAIREVNGTSSLIAPNGWGSAIRTMHSDSDYDNVIDQLIEETASGDIASFSDGANNLPCEVTCTLNPVQDLHGQDYPYPAGGGKNLWGGDGMLQDFINANIPSFTYDTTAKTLSYGAPQINEITVKTFSNAKPNTAYTFIISAKNSNNSAYTNLTVFYTDGTHVPIQHTSSIQSKTTFAFVTNSSKTIDYLKGENRSGPVTIYYDECCLLEGTKTVSDFAPYSNICPITGHDDVTVTQLGKNLLNGENQNVTQTNNGLVIPTNTAFNFYMFSGKLPVGSIALYDPIIGSNSTHQLVLSKNGSIFKYYTGGYYTFNVTSSDDTYAVRLYVYNGNTDTLIKPQMEIGSTSTDYKKYFSDEATITFPDTVYGASLDVGSGVLTTNYIKYKLGSSGWVESSGRYQHGYEGIMKAGSYYSDKGAVCDTYPKLATLASGTGLVFGYNSDYLYFYVKDDFPTLAEWTTYLDNNDVYVTMPLATPTTTQLTPEQLNSILGDNNFYHDGNGEIQVTYKANGELYVQQHS